jgi:hypothetical protein
MQMRTLLFSRGWSASRSLMVLPQEFGGPSINAIYRHVAIIHLAVTCMTQVFGAT